VERKLDVGGSVLLILLQGTGCHRFLNVFLKFWNLIMLSRNSSKQWSVMENRSISLLSRSAWIKSLLIRAEVSVMLDPVKSAGEDAFCSLRFLIIWVTRDFGDCTRGHVLSVVELSCHPEHISKIGYSGINWCIFFKKKKFSFHFGYLESQGSYWIKSKFLQTQAFKSCVTKDTLEEKHRKRTSVNTYLSLFPPEHLKVFRKFQKGIFQ